MTWLIFKSKASADVQMLSSHAAAALGVLGRDATQAGILLPQDLPQALSALRAAVEKDEAHRAALAQAGRDPDRGDDADEDDASASTTDALPLKRRLWPLMAMMERCASAGEPIVWQP